MKRYIRSAVIRDRDLDIDKLDYEVLLDLADDSIDPEFLRKLSDYDSDFLKTLVSENPNTPYDVTLKLHAEGYSRPFTLVINATNPDILAFFADDPDPDLRQRVLTNDNTSIDTLRHLLNDGTPYDLNYISWREDLPDDLILKISKSDSLNDWNRWRMRNELYKRGLDT